MNTPNTHDHAPERRACPRRHLHFPVMARGRDVNGVKFECAALLRDIGDGGARVRLTHPVSEGSTLEISFRASSNAKDSSAGPLISASGRVLRSTPQPLGTCDAAVQFERPLGLD